MLRRHNVALCMADCGQRFPSAQVVTADFLYIRFHGREQLYRSRYTSAQLAVWARNLVRWKKPAFVYFNNDFRGHAIANARTLRQQVRRLLRRTTTQRRTRAKRKRPRKARRRK